MSERIIYAIGDVHGEAERLRELHEKILADQARERAPALVVHLGDLVDRGPDSKGAVEAARALHQQAPAGVEVVTLRGNHEEMMVRACAPGAERNTISQWRLNGGDETIQSYGGDPRRNEWRAHIADADLEWLAALPTQHLLAERKVAFVHAGVDPETFPECDPQVRMWTRSAKFMNTQAWPEREALDGWTIVHGHTPLRVPVPDVSRRRINVDTAAVFGGPLSAVVLAPGDEARFIQCYRRGQTRSVAL